MTALLLISILSLMVVPGSGRHEGEGRQNQMAVTNGAPGKEMSSLRIRYQALQRRLDREAPTGIYLVVDTARNRLFARRGEQVLLETIVSTGSGTILDNPGRPGTQWVFDTPRGEFTIQSKLVKPLWVKPDWAFLEEGQVIPADPMERIESGILGDYALGFGHGYFIHGTLYNRLLGQNVTHGCIRLNDRDLHAVFKLVKVGTPVLIF